MSRYSRPTNNSGADDGWTVVGSGRRNNRKRQTRRERQQNQNQNQNQNQSQHNRSCGNNWRSEERSVAPAQHSGSDNGGGASKGDRWARDTGHVGENAQQRRPSGRSSRTERFSQNQNGHNRNRDRSKGKGHTPEKKERERIYGSVKPHIFEILQGSTEDAVLTIADSWQKFSDSAEKKRLLNQLGAHKSVVRDTFDIFRREGSGKVTRPNLPEGLTKPFDVLSASGSSASVKHVATDSWETESEDEGESAVEQIEFMEFLKGANQDVGTVTAIAKHCKMHMSNFGDGGDTTANTLPPPALRELVNRYKTISSYITRMKEIHYKDAALPSTRHRTQDNIDGKFHEDRGVKMMGWIISSHRRDIIGHPTILDIIRKMNSREYNVLNFLAWPLAKKHYNQTDMLACLKLILSNVRGIDIFRVNSNGEDPASSVEEAVECGVLRKETRNVFINALLMHWDETEITSAFKGIYNKLSPKNTHMFILRLAYCLTRSQNAVKELAKAMVNSVWNQPREAIRGDFCQRITNCTQSTLQQIVGITKKYKELQKCSPHEMDSKVAKLKGIDKYIARYLGRSDVILPNPIAEMVSEMVRLTTTKIEAVIKARDTSESYRAKYLSAAVGEIYRKSTNSDILEEFVHAIFGMDGINKDAFQCVSMFINHSKIKWESGPRDVLSSLLVAGINIAKTQNTKMCLFKMDDIFKVIDISETDKIQLVAEALVSDSVETRCSILRTFRIEEEELDKCIEVMRACECTVAVADGE